MQSLEGYFTFIMRFWCLAPIAWVGIVGLELRSRPLVGPRRAGRIGLHAE